MSECSQLPRHPTRQPWSEQAPSPIPCHPPQALVALGAVPARVDSSGNGPRSWVPAAAAVQEPRAPAPVVAGAVGAGGAAARRVARTPTAGASNTTTPPNTRMHDKPTRAPRPPPPWPSQREKLNQLLRLPTGAFVAKEGERPAYEVRARMFRSWRRLMCAWAPLMADPANAPGDAEKRLALLLMPLRDLWRREEAGGQPRTPADAAELAGVHLEAAEGWCALSAWLSELCLCLAGDMVWGLAVRSMAAHWHPALRKRFLSSVDAIYRRHATLAGLWLCRAQGRRMLCEVVSASLSAEAQAAASAAAASQPAAAPPPDTTGATLAVGSSGADCEASSVDLLCDVWVGY